MSLSALLSVPYSMYLPLASLLALVAAALVAVYAWVAGVKRGGRRMTAWDVAAALTFVGCAAAILGEIEHVAEYLLLDERARAPQTGAPR